MTYGQPGQNQLPTIEQYNVIGSAAYLFSDPHASLGVDEIEQITPRRHVDGLDIPADLRWTRDWT